MTATWHVPGLLRRIGHHSVLVLGAYFFVIQKLHDRKNEKSVSFTIDRVQMSYYRAKCSL
jgi:hypothetical protein